MDGQPGWRFCDKCFGMFFNGDPNIKGRCPAGDVHHAQGFVFYLPHDVPKPETVGQTGWRFCDKCFGMFFSGDQDQPSGRCPATGAKHNPQKGSFRFVLPHDVPAPEKVGQPGWSFCDACFGMFFSGNANRSGRCSGTGGEHNRQGFRFVLPHRLFPKPSIVIRPIVTNQRFIEVKGSGFEPDQTAQILHELRLTAGGFQPPGIPRRIRIDAKGNFIDNIPLSSEIKSAKVSAFDFGSGETAIATRE
jgi:hypothetical protein